MATGRDIHDLQTENFEKFMEDGPRLRHDYNVWVIARAPGRVKLGGLGAMGVGRMWVTEDEHHKDYPGYEDAPVVEHEDNPTGSNIWRENDLLRTRFDR